MKLQTSWLHVIYFKRMGGGGISVSVGVHVGMQETQCLFKAYHFGSQAKLAIYCNWNVRRYVPQHTQQIT